MSEDPLSPLIDALHASRLRVWSIVVTIFGDAIQPRGGRAAMSELQAITDRLGIEGGALRTAMSRLAKEGWVERDREGRNSFYALSAEGRRVFTPATERIYSGRFTAPDGPWVVAISQGNGSSDAPMLPLSRNVHLIQPDQIEARRIAGDLILTGTPDQIPDWLQQNAFDERLTQDYQTLADHLSVLTPDELSALPPLDALAMRTVLIHFWRRLVLRHPAPPAGLMPLDWPGLEGHTLMTRLYPALIASSESFWDAPSTPDARRTLTTRFQP